MKRLRDILIGLVLGLSALELAAQSSGGAFLPAFNYVVSGQWTWNRVSPWVIEGATADQYETTVTFTEPTGDRMVTFQNATHTVVGRDTTDTLSNKTIAAPVFSGSITGTYTLAGTPTIASPTITGAIITNELVTAAGATETLTSADCGQTTLLDTDAGSVITLPAATGSGCIFRFLVTDGVGSNAHVINVVGNDEFVGGLINIGTTADQTDAFTAAQGGDTDRISMNGTTSGGLEGTFIVIQDVAADDWALWGTVVGTDASASPLATGAV